MASKININLDTSKENYLVAKCKQNDDLTLEASIFENGLALDLTNKTITIQALKSDNTYIIQNTDIVKENNKINAELDRDFSRVPGTTKIEIVLVESSKQNTTFSFTLEVVGSVISGAVQSSDSLTALEKMQEAVSEIGRINQETQTLVNNAGAASKEEVNKINALLEYINNNVNKIVINPHFPPAPLVPAKGDGNANDTGAIQGAIDYVANRGGGIVIIPTGTHLVSTLKLKDRVTLIGLSWYSIIKSRNNNTESAIVQLYDAKQINCTIKKINIQGNKENQTLEIDGVKIDNSTASNDALHLFEDLFISDCSGNGFNMPAQSRENRLLNIFSSSNNKHGFNIQATDNILGYCTSAWNGLNGYNLVSAYSNKLETCKAFGNNGDGYYAKGSINLQLNNCDAQENGKNGFNFENMAYVAGSNLISDTNSTASNKLDVAFNLKNSHHIQIKGIASNNYNLLGEGHAYAVRQTENCYSNDISLMKYGNQKPMGDIDDQSKYISNKIEINNTTVGLINLQTNNILKDSNSDGVSDAFDTVATSPGILGSKRINYQKQAQELSIDSSTDSGSGTSISIEKTISISSGLILTIESLLELTDRINTNGQLMIQWYDNSNNFISDVFSYGNEMISLKGTAPINAISAKIRIKLYPIMVGSTGKMFIKSFKYAIC